jgi:hypothetical protein
LSRNRVSTYHALQTNAVNILGFCYTETMQKKKRPLRLLVVFFISLVALLYIVFTIPPNMTLPVVSFPALPVFFFFLFFTICSLISFIFKSFIHGVLAGLALIVYLYFRLINLTQPIYLILLIALVLTLELLFAQRKSHK